MPARRRWSSSTPPSPRGNGPASPLGRRVQLGGPQAPWRTIVGVAADVRHHGLDQPLANQVYVPAEQWLFADTAMTLVARSASPADAVSALGEAVRAVDATQPVGPPRAMEEVVRGTLAERGVLSAALVGFSLVALGLAAVGIYGVVSHSVARQAREIGVRTALGAGPAGIERWVLGLALRPAGLGLVAGLAMAPLVARLLGGQLWGVGALDPVTLGGASALLLGLAVAAAWLPARRAVRLDPVAVLRAD